MRLWARLRRANSYLEARRKAAETEAAERESVERLRQYEGKDEFGRPVRRVVVTDIAIPFWSMVGLLIELVLAAIPAIIILSLAFLAMKFILTYLLSLLHSLPLR